MIQAEQFIAAAAARGLTLYSGVPCSYLTPFINHAIGSRAIRYVPAANEGDAVAIGAGAGLGGRPAVVMFQNSGLGNAVNPLTSLTHTFRLPVLLIVTWRGEPGGAVDEPQHELMGAITPGLLDLMGIRHELFPDTEAAVGPALDRALAHMAAERRPYALVMRKGSVAESTLADTPARPRPAPLP
ncbi:MAG: phosphonopyruvate decarboxylase, partial [Gammaproteobacteria bacterium]|nr:phosphonopyruvate decarboxylase [Gammaproteobacteria bacterium]